MEWESVYLTTPEFQSLEIKENYSFRLRRHRETMNNKKIHFILPSGNIKLNLRNEKEYFRKIEKGKTRKKRKQKLSQKSDFSTDIVTMCIFFNVSRSKINWESLFSFLFLNVFSNFPLLYTKMIKIIIIFSAIFLISFSYSPTVIRALAFRHSVRISSIFYEVIKFHKKIDKMSKVFIGKFLIHW